ncbi:MAG: DUF177 domain-containing protein [Chloroflexi bacterium]|nr:DUF177 domain-containing protein [Chloroflexota bacterium]
MHFNVSQLVRETGGSTREHPVQDRIVFRDNLIEVDGSVRFVRTDRGVWVTALLNTKVESECGRCLDPYVQFVEIMVDEEAISRLDPVSGVRLRDSLDPEENLVIDEDNILDLTGTARQYISLGLPMSPLCSTDCAGLCAGCGVNRNQEECTCVHDQRDSRWGPLLDALPSGETMNLSKN